MAEAGPRLKNLYLGSRLRGALCVCADSRESFGVPATPASVDFGLPYRGGNRWVRLPLTEAGLLCAFKSQLFGGLSKLRQSLEVLGKAEKRTP